MRDVLNTQGKRPIAASDDGTKTKKPKTAEPPKLRSCWPDQAAWLGTAEETLGSAVPDQYKQKLADRGALLSGKSKRISKTANNPIQCAVSVRCLRVKPT